MPLLENGVWVPDLFGKQWEVFNSYDRCLLVSGPRLSAKSWACLHKIVRHMWETPGARVGMFTKVLKNSKDAGAWKNLHNVTIPEWIRAKMGFQYTTQTYEGKPGWKVDGQTRTPFFRVKNMHGGESECLLFSMDNDNEVEEKLKEREFSMVYFSELSNFLTRQVLSIALLSLRTPHLNYEQQQWIADTNPAEEGEQSWIYETWWVEKNLSYEDYVERQKKLERPIMSEPVFQRYKSGLKVIEMLPEENPTLKPGQLDELKATYAYDPGLYARYVEGKWVYGQGDSSLHFRRFFKPNIHVVGNCDGKDEETWEYLSPSQNCFEIITGLDPGDTNHACSIIERSYADQFIPKMNTSVKRACFSVVDEVVSLSEQVSIEDFTISIMETIGALEKLAGREYDLDRCYSDRSAIEKYSAAGDTFVANQIHAASMGRLMVTGVPKPKFSVMVRVRLLQQLLAQGRIKVSAHCFHHIEMFKNLKKGKDRLNFVVHDKHKHIFDALTYALIMECAEEIEAIPDVYSSVRRQSYTGIATSIK